MTETEIAPKNIITIEGNRIMIIDLSILKLLQDFMPGSYLTKEITWNDLIPMVEKVESLVDYIEIYFDNKFGTEVSINMDTKHDTNIRVHEKCPKIEAVFMAVVKYIEYYNKNK